MGWGTCPRQPGPDATAIVIEKENVPETTMKSEIIGVQNKDFPI